MPIVEAFPCWRRFVEFDTTIEGTTELLRAMAKINVIDGRKNPLLLADLFGRCDAQLHGRDVSNKGTTRLIQQRDGTEREVWIPGILPGTGIDEIVRDYKGPVFEKDRDGRTVYDAAGKPKIKTRWIPPVAPLEYEDEPVDRWCAFSVMAERSPKQTIRADCDCLSPMWAAYWYLKGHRAGVAISQPKQKPCCKGPATGEKFTPCEGGTKFCTPSGLVCTACGYGMAHAYTVFDDEQGRTKWFDGSAIAGMGQPKPSFYGSGETSILWLRED